MSGVPGQCKICLKNLRLLKSDRAFVVRSYAVSLCMIGPEVSGFLEQLADLGIIAN